MNDCYSARRFAGNHSRFPSRYDIRFERAARRTSRATTDYPRPIGPHPLCRPSQLLAIGCVLELLGDVRGQVAWDACVDETCFLGGSFIKGSDLLAHVYP